MSNETESTSDFNPVHVFQEAEEMDLRPGADKCDKNANCEIACPVAEVDETFSGPKFQGPEQWRLKRKDDLEIDSSITQCSNCMRCDTACPTEVPLSQLHNTARGLYVKQEISVFSKKYLRNRLLANYGLMAKFGSLMPRVTNAVLGNSMVRWGLEKTLGITKERDFPTFDHQTFRSWWKSRGGNQVENANKRVAYFHGDYANHNQTEVAKAMVHVFEELGYEIAVPKQRCSGTPMFANGMLDDARRAASYNVKHLKEFIENGYDVVATCTSCSMAIRKEYPELFSFEGTETVAEHTYDALEYLRIHEDLEAELDGAEVSDFPDLVYHAPCHGRAQGIDGLALEVIDLIDGIDAYDAGSSCSGISGTYGWKEEKYETSMEIGEEMFEHMEEAPAEHGITECPTCSSAMEHGTGYGIHHPMQVVEAVLVDGTSPVGPADD